MACMNEKKMLINCFWYGFITKFVSKSNTANKDFILLQKTGNLCKIRKFAVKPGNITFFEDNMHFFLKSINY